MKTLCCYIAFILITPAVFADHNIVRMIPGFELKCTRQIDCFEIKEYWFGIPECIEIYHRNKKSGHSIEVRTGYFEKAEGSQITQRSAGVITDHITQYLSSTETVRSVGPWQFHITLYEEETCGPSGKHFLCKYSAILDTVLEGFSYVQAWYESPAFLQDNIHKMEATMFDLLQTMENLTHDTHMYDTTGISSHFDTDAFIDHETALLQQRKAQFTRRSSQFLHHELDFHRAHSLQMVQEIIPDSILQKNSGRDIARMVADTLWNKILVDLQDIGVTLRKFDYTPATEFSIYARMRKRELPYSMYLDQLSQRNMMESGLDTLAIYDLCRQRLAFLLSVYSYNISSPQIPHFAQSRNISLEDNIPTSVFTPQLLKSVGEHEFHTSTGSYVHLDNTSHTQNFLLSINDDKQYAPLKLICFNLDQNTWNYTCKDLGNEIAFSHTNRLIPFNSLLVLEQDDKLFILDTSSARITTVVLNQYSDTLSAYAIQNFDSWIDDSSMKVHARCIVDTNLTPGNFKQNLWAKIVRNQAFHLDKPLGNYMYAEHGDTLVSVETYYAFAKTILHPGKMIYHIPYEVRDLDGNGYDELFSYSLSNGNLVELSCFTSDPSGVVQVERETAMNWLLDDSDFKNFVLYSQIGNPYKSAE